MLAELRLGIIDGNGTAIGNGIGVALNRLCSEELTALRRAAAKATAQPAAPGASRRGAGHDGAGRQAAQPR